jgi:hypothetical protein
VGTLDLHTGKVFSRSSQRPKKPLDTAKAYEIDWKHVPPILERAANFHNASYVYFIGEEDEGPVKIGVAKDPIKRLRGMQTGNSRRLRIERLLVGDREVEQVLHQYWEDFVIRSSASRTKPHLAPGTEWFRAEVREPLFPIITVAAQAQIESLKGGPLQIVRDAHYAHGFTAKGRDEVRLLGNNGSYVLGSRPSRI